jgi:hypothetical protein
MITKLRISEPEQTIYFEVGKSGLFQISVKNIDGKLIFERNCWELSPDINFRINTTSEIDSPEISINPSVPIITTYIDYISNKIYINSNEHIELKFRLYDTFNNRIIWRSSHKFGGQRFWHSPVEKLAKIGNLLLIVKDKWDNVIHTNHIKNEQYTFCHIPKTGGTSVKKVLSVQTNHNVFDRKNSNCFSFAFVRNPYQRFLSAYFFLVNGGLGTKQKNEKEKYIGNSDIDEFIKTKLVNSLEQEHFTPQHYFIPDGVDYLGKVETMQQDFNEICKVIGLEPIQLPYENKTPKYEYELTDEQKDIIYEIYKEDFIRFGYQK